MVAIAWSVINCPEDALECGRLLAKLIIETAEAPVAGPGRP